MNTNEELIARVRDPLVCTDSLHWELAAALEDAGARLAAVSDTTPSEGERETLARALFIASDDFAFSDRMAKAWDAPGPHGRTRWYNYADAVLAAGFRLTPPAPVDREKLIEKRLREIGAVKRGNPAFYKDDPEDWVNAPLSVVTEAAALAVSPALAEDDERIIAWEAIAKHPAIKACYDEERPLLPAVLDRLTQLAEVEEAVTELAPAPDPGQVVCEWCPMPARGSAWHNDGKLHPSCGQIDHGQGWVPDALAPARDEWEYGIDTDRSWDGHPLKGVGTSIEDAKSNVLKYAHTKVNFTNPRKRVKGKEPGPWLPVTEEERDG